MAVIALDRVWLHDPDHLADCIGLEAGQLQANVAVAGTVSRRAGGRRRMTRTPGVDGQLDIVFDSITITQRRRLEGWAGKTLLVRDPHGRVWTASYLQVQIGAIVGTDLLEDVAISLVRTTGTVEV